MKTALLFALIFALPAPLTAAGPARPGTPASVMICRDIQSTGSRLATSRVCRTREQWEDARRQAQADVANGQNRLMSNCPPNTRC
jgi:hypothetical protein